MQLCAQTLMCTNSSTHDYINNATILPIHFNAWNVLIPNFLKIRQCWWVWMFLTEQINYCSDDCNIRSENVWCPSVIHAGDLYVSMPTCNLFILVVQQWAVSLHTTLLAWFVYQQVEPLHHFLLYKTSPGVHSFSLNNTLIHLLILEYPKLLHFQRE